MDMAISVRGLGDQPDDNFLWMKHDRKQDRRRRLSLTDRLSRRKQYQMAAWKRG
jgi:hypothetical protein